MLLFSVILVVISGMANATWNFLAKRSEHKEIFLVLILIPVIVLLFPYLLVELLSKSLPAKAYILLAVSFTVQGCYGFLLSRMYKLGDLSQLYPIMRGTGTLFIPLISVFFLGETLSSVGWLGVAAIVTGAFFMSGLKPFQSRALELKPVGIALTIGLCITTYSLVDKLALSYISPLSLLQISNLGFIVGLLPQFRYIAELKKEWSINWRWIIIGAVLSPGSYLLFLYAMKLAPIAQVAPIREVGTVFATFLGIFILREKQSVRRIAMSLGIAAGIIFVSVGGG